MDPSEGRPYVGPSDSEELPPLYESVNSKDSDDKVSLCCSNINRTLLPFKAFYYFFYGAIGSLFPFLALYFRHLWLSPTQTGLLVGLRPVVQSLTGPCWALFADRFNAKKIVLFIGLCGWLFVHTSILLVPAGKKPSSCNGDTTNTKKRSVHDFSLRTNFASEEQNPRSFPENLRPNNGEFLDQAKQDDQDRLTRQHPELQYFPVKTSEHSPNITSEIKSPNASQPRSSKNKDSGATSMDNDNTWWTMSSSHVPLETWHTFSYLCLIIFVGNLFAAPGQTMANTAALQALGSETHKYGLQRCFGSIGWGVSAFTVGMLVSMNHDSSLACKGLDDINYSPCFYAFGILMLCALVVSMLFKFHSTADADQMRKTGRCGKSDGYVQVCQQLDCLTLFIFFTTLLAGFNMGFIQTFLFWHLQTLGGTQRLFSLITGINAVGEMTGFLLSVKLISKYGHLKVLAMGIFAYSIRLTVYGVVRNPWLVLLVEFLKCFTSSAVWASVMSYVSIGKQTGATLPGIAHMLYWGIGYGGGGMLGGILMEALGARTIFLSLAVISLVVVILILVVVHLDCCPKRKQDIYMPVESEDEEELESE